MKTADPVSEASAPVLLPGERIDDLQRGGCRIIQNSGLFCFGMDAVLLAAFAEAFPGEKVLDLCSGNGVIPILMDARSAGRNSKKVRDAYALPGASGERTAAGLSVHGTAYETSGDAALPDFTGVEINSVCVDMARRSAAMNGQQERVHFTEADIRQLHFHGAFDAVTVNPPYMTGGAGLTGKNDALTIARHEVMCTIKDVTAAASRALRFRGRLFMVHRPHRLMDVCRACSADGLEIKRLRMVHPFADKEANMVLIEAVKGGKPYLHVEKPLIVYSEKGVYTQEVREIYG